MNPTIALITKAFKQYGLDTHQWEAFVMGWCAAHGITPEEYLKTEEVKCEVFPRSSYHDQ